MILTLEGSVSLHTSNLFKCAKKKLIYFFNSINEEEHDPFVKTHWLRKNDVRNVPGTRTDLNDANMAAEDVIVDNLVKFWRIPAVRRYFHWMFLFITLAGSILKELEVIPQSYFSHRRNVINMYVPL